MEPDGEEPGTWFLLPGSEPLKLLQAAEKPSLSVPEKDPYMYRFMVTSTRSTSADEKTAWACTVRARPLLWRTGGIPCALWQTFLLD